eukprot:CAMPEP_0175139556 /NCGR_PEP_ID=MMETSP0087-20121206/10970_1 /TAXON_ID=136419 /ORGANISM="Unknown Unknown, Strain D1" /LENGTH=318 /DNA_ID=CAMNT_0016422583 /DNA_START=35 /DNA_END=991 /DNA_ORIENTATION=+
MGVLGLRHNSDIRTLAFTALFFILLAHNWANWETARPTYFWLMWCVQCYFSFVGAVAVHNIIHCPAFHGKFSNKVLQCVLSCTYGHPVSNYVPGHNLSHHQNTQSTRDVMRTSKLRFKWHLLNGLFFFPIIGIAMLGNDAEYFDSQKKNRRPIYKQMQLEKMVLWTFYICLLILDWRKALLLSFAPHLFAKFCIITLNMLQHDGCDQESEYNHSRNFVSPLLNFLCYNNGFHSIHHMHPGWHWSILPAKHAELVKPHIHPNLDQWSILVYIFKTFIFPGVRIDYLGKPVKLPPLEKDRDQPWFYDTNETYSSKGDDFN